MNLITKTELTQRWSKRLIKMFFPKCSVEKSNPYYRCSSPMQLYELSKVEAIEKTDAFQKEHEKVLARKKVAKACTNKKRDEIIKYAKEIHISIPDMEKERLINRACSNYNWWHSLDKYHYCYATPTSDEEFLKRITINFIRHQCTCYENELYKMYGKVGVQEAHDILQERINEAIKQKYEWLN